MMESYCKHGMIEGTCGICLKNKFAGRVETKPGVDNLQHNFAKVNLFQRTGMCFVDDYDFSLSQGKQDLEIPFYNREV